MDGVGIATLVFVILIFLILVGVAAGGYVVYDNNQQ